MTSQRHASSVSQSAAVTEPPPPVGLLRAPNGTGKATLDGAIPFFQPPGNGRSAWKNDAVAAAGQVVNRLAQLPGPMLRLERER